MIVGYRSGRPGRISARRRDFRYEVADRVATITLDRPEAATAQNGERRDQLVLVVQLGHHPVGSRPHRIVRHHQGILPLSRFGPGEVRHPGIDHRQAASAATGAHRARGHRPLSAGLCTAARRVLWIWETNLHRQSR